MSLICTDLSEQKFNWDNTHLIQGDQKSLLHYKNTQKYFKQFQTLTMITYLELGITDGVDVSLVSHWRVNKCLETDGGKTLNIAYNFLCFNPLAYTNGCEPV
jgi:hypothetical protein